MVKDKYYEISIKALTRYMKEHEQNPSEKRWNLYAVQNNYLSAQTLGYLTEEGFNTLCRKIRKNLNKQKRQN